MGDVKRSQCESAQEHDMSVKEDDFKSALSQHQVRTGHMVISKPVIDEVRVIDK